jgi:hypothetical protein
MNTIVKNNIKKIKGELTKGKFSTIKNSIKNDLRLSATSRFILLEVFSSSDNFAFSESYFVKFLGISRGTFYRYKNELIKFGYLKINQKVDNPNLNYYIFSEFGNLNSQEDKEPVVEEVVQEPVVEQEEKEEPIVKEDFFTQEEFSKWCEGKEEFLSERMWDLFASSNFNKKKINSLYKIRLKTYNDLLKDINPTDKEKKQFEVLKKWLKGILQKDLNLQKLPSVKIKWLVLKDSKISVDSETKTADDYENKNLKNNNY